MNASANITSHHVTSLDKEQIHFDHYRSGHKRVLILAHGFFNSKQAVLFKEMARMLSDKFDVIVFDFRGHGKSSGLFCWTAKEHLDLEIILDYARRYYQKVGVVGFSLGAAVSLIVASRSSSIDSLISVCAPTEFEKIDFRFWEMDIEENIIYNTIKEGRIGKGVRPGPLWFKKIKPIEAVSAIKSPVFFIHGQNDWLIKPWHAAKLFEKAGSQKRLEIVPGTTHAEFIFRKNPQITISLFNQWFEETLKV